MKTMRETAILRDLTYISIKVELDVLKIYTYSKTK